MPTRSVLHISRTSPVGSIRMTTTARLCVIFVLCFHVIIWGRTNSVASRRHIYEQLSIGNIEESHVRNSRSSDDKENTNIRFRRSPEEYCTHEKGISVGLVIDTTGSMANEIREVKKYAINILKNLTNAPGNRICDLLFVPTHDEIPTHDGYVKTKNLTTLTEAVKNIEADGGDDCAERTLVGVEKAIDLAEDASYIFVFTDADPKDYYLYDTVKTKMQRKQITIYFLLTGDCGSGRNPAESFVQLSRVSTKGQWVYIDKNSDDIEKIMTVLKDEFKNQTEVFHSATGPSTPPDGELIPVPVPPGTPEVRVTGSGDEIQVELRAPDGSTPENIKKLMDRNDFKIYSVPDPAPGVWTINLKSESPFKVVATGVSDVDIGFGFSVVPTDDIMSVAKRPGVDTESYLLLRVSDPNKVFNISRVEIIVDGTIVQSLPVESVDVAGGVFRAKRTTYPNKAFKIRIIAFSSPDGYLLTRESLTTIEPQEPGPPAIECRDRMLTSAGSAFNLTCTVESDTAVEVKMYKEGSTHTHTERHRVTTRVSISFPVVRKKDSGYYIIEAKNRGGEVTKKIHLEVHENPPKAFMDTPLFGVIGNNKTINCRCDSFTDCTIEWTKSSSPADDFFQKPAEPMLSGENVKVEEVRVMLTPLLGKDYGWYICTARNGGGTSVAKAYLEVRERPEVEITDASSAPVILVNFMQWSNVSITCRAKKGLPVPHLSWFKNNRKILENKSTTIRGKDYVTHTIRNAQKYMEGDYLCRGNNVVDIDEKKVTLQFVQAPKITRPSTYSSVFLVGTDVTLVCYFIGIPVPAVTWTRKIKDSIMPIETREGSRTVQDTNQANLTLPKVRFEDTGTYYCEASNVAGSKKAQMKVEVEEKPSFKITTDEVTVPLNGTVELSCNPAGVPIPRISWWKIDGDLPGQIIGSNYRITNAALEEQGVYVCRAENNHGADEFRVRVQVSGAAPPKIVKESMSDTVSQKGVPGGEVTLNCPIFQGKPVPTLSWIHNGKTVRNERPFSILQEYSSLTIKPVTESETGNYTCIAENQVGKDRKTFLLTLYKLPRIIEPGGVTKVRNDTEVLLTCRTEGDPLPNVTWSLLKNRTETAFPMTALGSSTLVVAPYTVKRKGKYLCRARNYVGVAKEVFEVIVLIPPKIRVSWEKKITTTRNEFITLNCTARGNPKPTITWTHDGITLSTTDPYNPILRLGKGTGTYGCTAENEVGKDSRLTVIDRLAPPVINDLPPVTQTAVGKPVVLKCTVNGNPVATISWDFNGNQLVGKNHFELEIPSVSKSIEGKYTCNARNSEGYDQKSTRLIVMDKPIINCLQQLYEVNSGKIVNFQCETEANPKAEIRWYKDGRLWESTPDDGSLQFVAKAKDSGQFLVQATNEFGSDSETIDLTVLSSPTFSPSHRKEISVTAGSNAVLPCQADGFPHPNIIWDVFTMPAPRNKVKYLAESGSLEILDVRLDYEGDYKCTAENKAGSQIHFIHLNVVEKPRVKIVAKDVPTSGDVNSGDDVMLTCDVNGKPTPELVWFKDGQVLSSNPVIRFTASESKSGSYTCQAKNGIGEASDSISVNAISLPAFRDPSYEQVTCVEGHELDLLCSAFGNPPPTISWYKNDQKLVNSSETMVSGPLLRISNVSKEFSGNITCKAANLRGTFKKMFGIQVDIRPKIVHKPPYEIPIYFNTGFSVPCKAEGSPKPLIEWTIDTGSPPKILSPGDSYGVFSILPDGTLLAHSVTWTYVRIVSCSASNTAGSDDAHYVLRVSELPIPETAILRLLERSPSATVVKAKRGKREILDCPSVTVNQWLKDFDYIPSEDMSGDRPRYSLLNDRTRLSVNEATEADIATYTCFDSRGKIQDFILNVLSEPHFSGRPDDEERYPVVENDQLTIYCGANGNPKPMIFWYVKDKTYGWIPTNNYTMDSAVFSGDQNEYLHINSAITSHTGQYKCVALNQDGSQSRQFSIAVAAIPKLKGDKEVTVDVAVGQPLKMECEIEGDSDLVYQWFIIKDRRTSSFPKGDKTLVINPSRLEDSGSYRCTGTSRTGLAQQEFVVNVVVPPRLKGETNTTVKFFLGDKLELECIPEESVDIVNWSKGEEKILRTERVFPTTVGFGDVLNIINATEADGGMYECSVHNVAGAAKRNFFLQFIDVIPNSKTVVNFTLGDPFRLPCPLTNGDPSGKIIWKKDGSVIQRPSLRGLDLYKYESNRRDEGLYECVLARKTNNISLTFQVNMLISPKVLKTRTARALDLRAGEELVLECAAEGVPKPMFYWTKNDDVITDGIDSFYISSSDGSSTLMKRGISNSDGGQYICHAWSESGESAAFYDVIIVGNAKEYPNGSVTRLSVQLGRPVTITCPFIETIPENVVWKKGGYAVTKTDLMSLGFNSSFTDGYGTLQAGHADPEHGDVYVCTGESDSSAKTHTIVVNVAIPMYYKDWADWSDCSASCGGGTKERERVCEASVAFQPEDIVTLVNTTCVGKNEQSQSCNQSPCPVDGGWREWREWGPCSQSCGSGVRKRIRLCDDPPPSSGGKSCHGRSEQESPCGDAPCPIDGGWSDWTRWTSCSALCGTGLEYRYRQCDRPKTAHGGKPCAGSPYEQRICLSSAACDGNGKEIKENKIKNRKEKPKWIWSEWEFEACAPGCYQTRNRKRVGTCEGSACKKHTRTQTESEPCPQPPECK